MDRGKVADIACVFVGILIQLIVVVVLALEIYVYFSDDARTRVVNRTSVGPQTSVGTIP